MNLITESAIVKSGLNNLFSSQGSDGHVGLGDIIEQLSNQPSGSSSWGGITGTLSSQTDLQSALNGKQNSLGFTAENVANKDTDGTLSANSDVKYPSQKAVKTYIDLSAAFIDGFRVVSKTGNDTSGNGSYARPYATFAKAFATITDASPTKRYVVIAMPGRYIEATWLHPANVFVWGFNLLSTYITVTSGGFVLDPVSFAVNQDNRSGLVGINIRSTVNIDYTAGGGSNQGKFYIEACQIASSTVTFTAFSNINQNFLSRNDVFADVILNACNTVFRDNYGFGGNIVLNAVAGRATLLEMISGTIAGNVTVNGLSTDSCGVEFLSCDIQGNLTATGTTTQLYLDVSSWPQGTLSVTGASLTRLDPATSLGYVPGISGNWAGTAPNNVQAALDRMAALLKTLNSNNPIP